MSAPTAEHEERRAALDAIAILSGFTAPGTGGFPDGCRPDVLRLTVDGRCLFIGDAKATETPGNSETLLRLHAYSRWAAGARDGGGAVVVMLCTPTVASAYGWRQTLREAAQMAGVREVEVEVADLGDWGITWWTYGLVDVRLPAA